MRILTSLFLILLISCSNENGVECNYIKDYYPNTSKAEIEFYLGNYKKAYSYYKKAFESCDAIRLGMHYDTDKFATICAKLGKNELALDYVEKTIEKGGILNSFVSDSAFNKIFETLRGQKIINEYDKKREKYLSSINMNLRSEIIKMIEIDQKLKGKERERIFKVNGLRLKEIFEEYGYPNEQIIGNYTIDFTRSSPHILLQHTTKDSIGIKYFMPKMKEFIQKGQCAPILLGNMYDLSLLMQEKPQVYGTYKNGNTGEFSNMILDLDKVDENRAEIGLPSLKTTKLIDSLRQKYYE